MRFLTLAVLLVAAPAFAQKPVPDPLYSINLPKDWVVAEIDGEQITLDEITEYSKTQDHRKLYLLNMQLHDFREKALHAYLGEKLIKAEAAKANMTVLQYLDSKTRPDPVTPEEVLQLLSTRPPGGDEEAARRLAEQYLMDMKRSEAHRNYINKLIEDARKKAQKPLVIHLEPPRVPIEVRPTDSVRGSGPIELVEFSDFECPFCSKAQGVLKEVLAQFEGKVKHVWKDFPLPNHQHAMIAAVGGRCAHQQGKFWEYHDRLFDTQMLAPADLRQHARQIGLNLQAFEACLTNGAKYRDEIETGRSQFVMATPTVFINGRVISGVAPQEEYARIIRAELERVSR